MAGKKSYVVVAPYVTLSTGTSEGQRVVGFYQGAAVPSDVSDESIQHHLDSGLIEEAKQAEETLAGDPAVAVGAVTSAAEPPAKSASKSEWRDYAVSQGMPADEAEATTRDDLAAKYS